MIREIGFNLPDCESIRFQSAPTLFYRDNFDALDLFFKNYEKNKASQAVLNQLQAVVSKGQRLLDGSNENSWYGLKSRMKEKTWRYLYDRTDFVYNDIYEDLRNKTWNQLQRLLRNNSIAEIIKKDFEWNEKELGLFSFDRASLGLFPKYCYYSLKYKQTYQEDFVEIIGDGENAKYFLKSDKSPIQLSYEVNLFEPNEKGEDKIYINAKDNINIENIDKIGYLSVASSIKKSFIYQVPKPKIANAIRLFIDFGCNGDILWKQKIYCGMLGIIIAEFFEYLGYATSIVPYIGFQRYSNSKNTNVYRLLAYQGKKFTETLETEKLLLSCSDIAFFRTRFFFYAHLLSDYYGDEVDEGIGFNMTREEKHCSIIQQFKNKDKNIDVFYVNVADIISEQQVLEYVTYLIFNIDNENRKLRNERLGIKEDILTEQQLRERTNDTLNDLNQNNQ